MVGDLEFLVEIFLQLFGLLLQNHASLFFLQQFSLFLFLFFIDGSQLTVFEVEIGVHEVPIGLQIALYFLLIFVFYDILI